MAQDHQASTPPQVSADMVAKHLDGWHVFTHGMFYVSIATAAVLVFLLLVGKVF